MLTLRQCASLLKPLMKMDQQGYFLVAVDAVALRIPDYHTIVKEPMDLGTVEKRLDSGHYHAVEDFISDVKLVWYNAMMYNKQGDLVHEAARKLAAVFDQKLEALAASSAGTGGGGSAGPATGGSDGGESVAHTLIRPIIKSLQSHALSKPFRVPLDYMAHNLPHYPQMISKPMDLLTVSTNLEQGQYATVAELRCDLELIWQNSQDFNGANSWVGKHAETLRGFTAKKFAQAGIPDGAAITYAGAPWQPSASAPSRKRSSGAAPSSSRPPPAERPAPPLPSRGQSRGGPSVATDDVVMTMGQCRGLLKPFLKNPSASAFLEPVDSVALNIPDYPVVSECVCVCIYVCIHTHTYIHIYLYLYIQTNI